MHALPFRENEFDVVICGWTLSYSAEPRKAIDEMIRVTRSGGVLAIGVEYSTLTAEEAKRIHKGNYSIEEFDRLPKRINSVNDIKELVGDRLGEVYFSHDAPNKISHRGDKAVSNVSNVALVASIIK
jgi:SAM-dependent methyltransferase